MKITFEKTECSRCGGTGHYSYCQTHGTTCFQCAGTKFAHSKAGAKAHKAYQAWADVALAVRVEDIEVGRVYRFSPSPRDWRKVLSAPVLRDDYGTIGKDGKVIPSYKVETKHVSYRLNPGATVLRRPTADELRAVFPTLGPGATLTEEET